MSHQPFDERIEERIRRNQRALEESRRYRGRLQETLKDTQTRMAYVRRQLKRAGLL